MQEGYAIAVSNLSRVGMVADYHCDFSVELTELLALQKILVSVRQARGEESHFGLVAAEMNFESHIELLG